MVVSTGWSWWHALGRRKVLDSLALGSSELARVLSTFDLTALGVGSTLGVGVYVLAGNVSKNIAGPAVVVSFLIAAVASLFAGLCYAEFGARVPRAGSAYIYSYVCVGEFVAFIIGWNLILEYVIGSASVARGLSKYLDSLLNETMEQTFLETMPMATDSFALSPYFDIFAFGISFILAVALSLGVKESSLVNSLFTIVNIAVVLFVILAGSFKADSKNWAIKKEDIITDSPQGGGEGGFFPFGVSGAIKGAATCFYGFVGFDCVATTGEEVRNPQKAIPIAIILSLTIIFLSYFGVSTVLTLMWPYYLQDSDAPIPKVFLETGWPVAQWIVTIGGIFGLCASLFGAMFPLPRIIYAMAMDGLIFQFLGKVHHYFKTPFYGTLIAGLLTGLMAAIFDLDQLVNMMSIGTLLAYTIVAACVLLLRYKADVHEETEGYALLPSDGKDNGEETVYTDLELCGGSDIVSSEYIESTNLVTLKEPVTFGTVSRQLFNPFRKKHPTFLSSSVVTVEVLVFGILSTLLGLCVVFWERDLADLNPWALSVTSVIGGILVLILLSVSLQPPSSKPLSFKVPFVPVVPAVSIVINIYLMLRLDGNTWIRFGVWMAIGVMLYFGYSIRHSEEAMFHCKTPIPVKGSTR
ncbi:high affinity cationic amino acid transporter 1 isoform X3 [Cryptotermes secundus]|uniref:high affinity cationic amino acid transporter 1 isoform X3 n=1 Tax=Cryptotermes secundus TaxID=105785 RepID=UPI001454D508|nr:high affinity cationic amino acid transporter 1 isoform X3 [Cryptotermes secundus]